MQGRRDIAVVQAQGFETRTLGMCAICGHDAAVPLAADGSDKEKKLFEEIFPLFLQA
jgi:hypothetical protein